MLDLGTHYSPHLDSVSTAIDAVWEVPILNNAYRPSQSSRSRMKHIDSVGKSKLWGSYIGTQIIHFLSLFIHTRLPSSWNLVHFHWPHCILSLIYWWASVFCSSLPIRYHISVVTARLSWHQPTFQNVMGMIISHAVISRHDQILAPHEVWLGSHSAPNDSSHP